MHAGVGEDGEMADTSRPPRQARGSADRAEEEPFLVSVPREEPGLQTGNRRVKSWPGGWLAYSQDWLDHAAIRSILQASTAYQNGLYFLLTMGFHVVTQRSRLFHLR